MKSIIMFKSEEYKLDKLEQELLDIEKVAKNLDLNSIKIIASTGSPLAEESFKYVYDNIKKDVHLTSIAGGTDLVGCLVLGNLFSNVHKGEIQGQSLGIDVDVFTDNGNSAADGDKGELVVKQPFPSMPIKFWGDDDYEYWLFIPKESVNTFILNLMKFSFNNDKSITFGDCKKILEDNAIEHGFDFWV